MQSNDYLRELASGAASQLESVFQTTESREAHAIAGVGIILFAQLERLIALLTPTPEEETP